MRFALNYDQVDALRLEINSEPTEAEAKITLIMKEGGVQGNCDSRRTIKTDGTADCFHSYQNILTFLVISFLPTWDRRERLLKTTTTPHKKKNKTPMAGPRYCAAGRSACRCQTPVWKPLRLVSPAEVRLLPGWEKPAGSASRTRCFHHSSFLNNYYILRNKEEGS